LIAVDGLKMWSLNMWGTVKNQLITIYENQHNRCRPGRTLFRFTKSYLWLFSKKTLSESRKACLCE